MTQIPFLGIYPNISPNVRLVYRKTSYIYVMKYYSSRKRHAILIYATTCVSIKNSMLSERSQTYKIAYCMIPLYEKSRKGKPTVIKNRSVVA